MSDDFDSMELPMKVMHVSRLMRIHRSEKAKDGMDPMAGQGRDLALLKMTGADY